jgi:hypothetical protein
MDARPNRTSGGIEDVDEKEETLLLPYKVNAYGADFPVDALVSRLDIGDIVIPTFEPEVEGDFGIVAFQRGFVWKKLQCDRFVESILLNLPVPGIFLVHQPNDRFLVLDGQQRLRTLQAFKKGLLKGQGFTLEHVQPTFKGRAYDTLEADERRRFNNGIIHATIVKQEPNRTSDNAIYALFERLNTGGTNLEPQEIRVSLYRGNFVRLLRNLNQTPEWQGLLSVRLKNLKDHELILRFFAMLIRANDYRSPLKQFLNDFMGDNQDLPVAVADEWTGRFRATVQTLQAALGNRAFRLTNTPNAAIVESVMVGVARRLESVRRQLEPDAVKEAYDALLQDPEYKLAISRGTASEERVRVRLAKATEAFARVG